MVNDIPCVAADGTLGEASLCPHLPITLSYRDRAIKTMGLLDTGAAMNVLPYRSELAFEITPKE
ncbi:hypothetical protein BH10CHL1_BH10CHL1_38440 [soil metagenome]